MCFVCLNHSIKQSDVGDELRNALLFSFGFAIAHPQKYKNRRNVHNRKRFGILVYDLTVIDQPAEYHDVIIYHSFNVKLRIKPSKLGRTELLDRNHSPQTRNRIVVQRIRKHFAHFRRERF